MNEYENLWFPRYWVIKATEDPRREDFFQWYKENYWESLARWANYYWYIWNPEKAVSRNSIENLQNNPTLVTLDQRVQESRKLKVIEIYEKLDIKYESDIYIWSIYKWINKNYWDCSDLTYKIYNHFHWKRDLPITSQDEDCVNSIYKLVTIHTA
jgi:hypothetical protein